MLRSGLRDMGIHRNTLVWYCSDNGGLSEDPDSVGKLRGHKGSLYEGGIRVPGIIEWPGRINPAITDIPASTMDIMPTLVDLLGLPDDSQLSVRDGESIAPLLAGAAFTRQRPIPFTSKGCVLIDGRFKLLSLGRSRNREWTLYDLERDPGETKDVSAEHPERFRKLRARADAILKSVEASAAGKDYPEGKVIQPPRHGRWHQMEAYKPHLETFAKLKPGFKAKASGDKSRKTKKARKAGRKARGGKGG